jgi:ribonuclease E
MARSTADGSGRARTGRPGRNNKGRAEEREALSRATVSVQDGSDGGGEGRSGAGPVAKAVNGRTGPPGGVASAAGGAQAVLRKPRIGDTKPAPPKGWKIRGNVVVPAAPSLPRKRRTKALGRYLGLVHVHGDITHLAILEGRTLIEHYVARSTNATTEILGNIYLGRVNNIVAGMETAFVDIGTGKNAVLYRHDVREEEEEEELEAEVAGEPPRIEEMLKPDQPVLVQVVKNPIGEKGARLTQDLSLPGRFVVLKPNKTILGISKRIPEDKRRKLRRQVAKMMPPGCGIILRTAAEQASEKELKADIGALEEKWREIEQKAANAKPPSLLYAEPPMVMRVLREEVTEDFRAVYIDDERMFREAKGYVAGFDKDLASRVRYYDARAEGVPLFERFQVVEQLRKAIEKKVWLPSGGSIVIEQTEALTVIDVNTSKFLGKTSLEQTVYENNLEAAEEIARQLRLRDIGGIIVIDFIDMKDPRNRENVVSAFKQALARDRTKTQVVGGISELGLLQMTRKRVGEALSVSLSRPCEHCQGTGRILDADLIG